MLRARVIVTVTALSLLAAGCGGEVEDEPTASASPSAAVSSSAPAGSDGPSASAEPTEDVTEIKVTVTGSKVSPRPSTRKVAKGAKVRIVVTSDKDDELHVHGYDLPKELKAGEPATLEFTADQTGRFEVETHESGLLLFQLQVS